ncbi:MAG: DUF305 domain-containing protein [Deltaproteobacteria bacterium]|nr:MAG: DUF305 domain-containing protein [Deltaproteobacteria bacterium]
MRRLRDWLTLRSALLALVLIGGATALAANIEDEFLAENDAAMMKMMVDMDVDPTGDVDADFVATMIPHHQGAIDMARAQLRYGANEQVRRIAQEIIATQGEEIAALRLAAGQSLAQPCTSAGPS